MRDSISTLREAVFEESRKLRRKRCVERKPRNRRLSVRKGSKSAARKKSAFAGRGSALNRRRRAHIGGLRSNQTIFDKMLEKLGEVGSQRVGINVIFLNQLKISRCNGRPRGHQLPHAGSHGIQTEIPFGIQVKEHRFLVQKTDQNVRGNDCAGSK